MNMSPAVAYCRSSSAEQDKTGLDAQWKAIVAFGLEASFDIEWFIEVASIKSSDTLVRRPKLAEALARARALGCPLIVSKLDRLSLDMKFISELMAQRVEFIVADVGRNAAPFVLSAFSPKARPKGPRKRTGTAPGAEAMRRKALERAIDLQPEVAAARDAGCKSDAAVMRYLNGKGIPGPAGEKWNAMAVGRLLKTQAQNGRG